MVREHQERDELVIAKVMELRQIMPNMGTRKLLYELHALGDERLKIGRDYLFYLLWKRGMLIKRKRRFIVTSLSKHAFKIYPNLLPATIITRPNQVWVSDITYLRICKGFVFLFLITDYYSRKIVGYYVSDSLATDGACLAFRQAFSRIKSTEGLIHHSDHGIQYCSSKYTQILMQHQIQISMTGDNHCYDNAVAERVNGILKLELGLGMIMGNLKHAREAVVDAVSIYNYRRPHLSLNYRTPGAVYAA
jgi:putative transposase